MIHHWFFLVCGSILILILHFSNQEIFLTQDQLAEMPSCNLAESIHNKWLQASGNKGGNLYVAMVDDYVQVFLQVVAYYTFLKGGIGGDGPNKEELKLRGAQRRAQRTGDPLCCRRSCLACLVGKSFVLAIHTLRAPRCLDPKSEDRTLQLVVIPRSTAPIP